MNIQQTENERKGEFYYEVKGYKLVEAAVNFARENNIKIMPLCSFANAVFRKRSDYNDVRF